MGAHGVLRRCQAALELCTSWNMTEKMGNEGGVWYIEQSVCM